MSAAERADYLQWQNAHAVWQTAFAAWQQLPAEGRGKAPSEPLHVFSAAQVLRAEAMLLLNPAEAAAYRAWEQQQAQANAASPPTAFEVPFSALCLSGGGIRSAAFCLGVIQAFAARGMLKQFHYLSTVSGGGYIGGWLTRCIAAWKGDLDRVEAHLNVYKPVPADGTLRRNDHVEPPELRRLRRYTNFLTPSPGFASTDTWAIVILWLRNTLINWAVFTPLFLAAAGLPVLYYALICLFGGTSPASPWYWIIFCCLGLLSLFCIGIANYRICLNLPTHKQLDYHRDMFGERGFGLSGPQIMRSIGVFSLAWTLLAPLAVAPLLSPPQAESGVHAAFWGNERPAPVCALPTAMLSKTPLLPAQEICKPPRKLALLPAPLEAPFRRAPLHQRAALYVLPALLWCTYLAAFLLARYNIFLQYNRALAEGPALAQAAAQAAAARPNDPFAAADAQACAEEAGPPLPGDTQNYAEKLLYENLTAFDSNLMPWMISGLIGALVILGGMALDFGHHALWLALAGPLWITGAELLRSAAYVAVRKDGLFSDLDREWLARLSGDKLRFAIFGGAIGTAAVFLPWLVLDNFKATDASIGALLGSGTLTAFLGQSARTVFLHGVQTADDKKFWTIDRLIPVLALIFGTSLFMIAGRIMILLACGLAALLTGIEHRLFQTSDLCPGLDEFARVCLVLVLITGLFAGIAMLIDHGVNLNRFSLHAMYRNRIIRAFLGTARAWFLRDLTARDLAEHALETHQPEPIANRYTGFSPNDNMRISEAMQGRSEAKLFPVIHATLNRTSGKDTARATRKGVPFTITPLHCGSPSLKKWWGAYIATPHYAGGEKETGVHDRQDGMTLGTAMAISGAAVSPNMGYNSSPFTAFLMTLFNVRLGAWLPNPAARHIAPDEAQAFFERAGPVQAIPTMLQELTGQSDDTGKYVYLSDGGHFDNLGLYEMLRRRCKYIVVIDAGADPGFKYFDLGHTLEMASIDLGVQIEFAPPLASAKPQLPVAAAFARIAYPPDRRAGTAGAAGQLIYLKPWLPDDAPIELLSYKQIKPDFPHEPTEDQFFTESDFESYRRLGEYLANNMLRKLTNPDDIAALFKAAETNAAAAPKPASPQPRPKPKAGDAFFPFR
jgi:hypothetical protein